jgi:hypothetical protein
MVKILPPVINYGAINNDFSGGLDNLTILNPDGGITWLPINITTCEASGDTALFVENYVYSSYGQDEILLPINLDLNLVVDPVLEFRVAYAPYYDGNAFIDSLKVLISTDCGSSFQTIFRSGGEALSTTTSGLGANNLYEQENFSPQNCDEWRDIALDLKAFTGKYVTIKILNQSGYGNNMYLDDLALTGTFLVGTQPTAQRTSLRIQPNPTRNTTILQGNSRKNEQLVVSLYHITGQQIWTRTEQVAAGTWTLPIPMETLPSGVYSVRVMDELGGIWVRKVMKE